MVFFVRVFLASLPSTALLMIERSFLVILKVGAVLLASLVGTEKSSWIIVQTASLRIVCFFRFDTGRTKDKNGQTGMQTELRIGWCGGDDSKIQVKRIL